MLSRGEWAASRRILELQEENERLRRELAARDEFIATASHELRNPMAAVLMNATNLVFAARQKGDTPEWIFARLESLDRQARHFVRRSTMILNASRVASGAFTLKRERTDLGRVVSDVVRELAPEAERTACPLHVEVEDCVVGDWDAAAVESIAYNLLSNAIKYGAGRPVHVRTHAAEDAGALVVRDEGMGIPLEDQARIFGRFERLGRTDRPGFGVGLWLARQFALAHGGDIEVDSAPGRGSIFTATLPRCSGALP